jgi:hypothetical protein
MKSAPMNTYAGILAEPLAKRTALSGPTDEEVGELLDAKIKALFQHFGVDASDAFDGGPRMASAWAKLVFALARQHVPGFKGAPRGRGALATRKSDDVTLVMHVELLRRRDGLSDRSAIRTVVAQNLVSGSNETLRTRYKNAKHAFAPLSVMFDNASSLIGKDRFLCCLAEALSGEGKETFLSPP